MKAKTKIIKVVAAGILLVCAGFLAVCRSSLPIATVVPDTTRNLDKTRSFEPIVPIPTNIELDGAKVALGEKLFDDVRLSRDNSVSCVSCHSLSLGGTDQRSTSVGIDGQTGEINAPTVFNSSLNFRQFWDGRAPSVEEQIDGPIHSDLEMATNWQDVINKLEQSPECVAEFASIYRDGIRAENIKDAIATYERSLTTPNSRFDLYLLGDADALTGDEKEGYRTFKTVGCSSCHQGINIGGNLFQEFGVMGSYFKDRGNISKADYGRFNVTGDERDRYVFKVPSLRNISQTHPYFHDGTGKTLEDAVATMSRYQLGRKLSVNEIDLIVKFLSTLDGEYTRYAR